MKVYISGKIGEEVLTDATREKFAKAERLLKSKGYDVFNPTTSGLGKLAEELARQNGTDFYTEIMKLDLEQLEECDAIYMLKDWWASPGAKQELGVAVDLKIKVFFEEEGPHSAMHTCCLCERRFYGWGNNPQPVRDSGVCCDDCNYSVVLKERLTCARK